MQLEDLMTEALKQRVENDFDGLIRNASRSLDRDGIAVIEGFFKPEALRADEDVRARQRLEFCTKGKRIPLVGDDLKGTIFFDMAKSQLLVRISNALIRRIRVQRRRGRHLPGGEHTARAGDPGCGSRVSFRCQLLNRCHSGVHERSLAGSIEDSSGSIRNLRSFSTNWFLNKFYWNVMKLKLARDRLKAHVRRLRGGQSVSFLRISLVSLHRAARRRYPPGQLPSQHRRPALRRDEEEAKRPVSGGATGSYVRREVTQRHAARWRLPARTIAVGRPLAPGFGPPPAQIRAGAVTHSDPASGFERRSDAAIPSGR